MIKCKVCGREHGRRIGLSTHLWKTHKLSRKEYYDTFFKKEGEDLQKFKL